MFFLAFTLANGSALYADDLGVWTDLKGLVLAVDNLFSGASKTVGLACLARLARSWSGEVLIAYAQAASKG